ncbi:MAG: hypothetical protein JRH06_01500 [Deltaproteobacteria bacterium]|nr:hypothetical protein [Deltaproteobacteria bacterium]
MLRKGNMVASVQNLDRADRVGGYGCKDQGAVERLGRCMGPWEKMPGGHNRKGRFKGPPVNGLLPEA